jgi:hypothetical protein
MIWEGPARTPLYDMVFSKKALKTPDAYDGDTLEPPSEHLAICYDDMRLKIHGEKEKVWKAPTGRILGLEQLTEPKITLACNSYVREKSRVLAWLGYSSEWVHATAARRGTTFSGTVRHRFSQIRRHALHFMASNGESLGVLHTLIKMKQPYEENTDLIEILQEGQTYSG